jgi:ATP-dependent DNA helicase PIF1
MLNLQHLDPDQQLALQLIHARNNVFVTGRAGTGKSTLLNAMRATLPGEVVYLAPTGMAARNVDGSTVHSFFSFPPADILPLGYIPNLDLAKEEVLACVDTIVIDESSMIRADIFATVDNTLRHYAPPHLASKPFGGKQVVMVGDFFQLPPVVRHASVARELQRDLGGRFAFGPPAWQLGAFQPVVLRQVHRQAADLPFLAALDCIRRGQESTGDPSLSDCVRWLNENVQIRDLPPKGVTALCTTRRMAATINGLSDSMLPGPVHACEARIWGTFEEDEYPTERWLQFRIGSRVMLVANQPDAGGGGFVNGDTGHVVGYDPVEESATIQLDDGRQINVGRFAWPHEEYTVTRHPGTGRPHLERQILGSFSQLPFKLASAITIHKSQGLTLERAHIDLGRGTFAEGQLYTGLSRCRSLSGLTLNRPLQLRDVLVDPSVVEFYDGLQMPDPDEICAMLPAATQ